MVVTMPALMPENSKARAKIVAADCPIVVAKRLYRPGMSASLASSESDAAAMIKMAEFTKVPTINSTVHSSAIVYDMHVLIAVSVG